MSNFTNEILADIVEDKVAGALDGVMNEMASSIGRRSGDGKPTEGDVAKIKILIDLIGRGAEAWRRASLELEAPKTETGKPGIVWKDLPAS